MPGELSNSPMIDFRSQGRSRHTLQRLPAASLTAPGVGALVAITFKSAVDDPHRFAKSKSVGAHFPLG